MASQHRGIVLLPEWALRDWLRHGELVQVGLEQPLSVGRGDEAGLYLMYLLRRYQIPKVRQAVDFLMAQLAKKTSASLNYPAALSPCNHSILGPNRSRA